MNNPTAFAKSPNEWTHIERNVCIRRTAWSSLWWRPCYKSISAAFFCLVHIESPFGWWDNNHVLLCFRRCDSSHEALWISSKLVLIYFGRIWLMATVIAVIVIAQRGPIVAKRCDIWMTVQLTTNRKPPEKLLSYQRLQQIPILGYASPHDDQPAVQQGDRII